MSDPPNPHLCREYHEKKNVTFHPNDTVAYLQQRWWVWDQQASGNLSQDDSFITLNTIPVVGGGGGGAAGRKSDDDWMAD